MCFRNGGMLTGAEIEKQIKKGHIGITPYDTVALNPNSYNLKLHPQLLIYARDSDRADILKPDTEFQDPHFIRDLESILSILESRITAIESRNSFNSIDASGIENKSNRIMKSIKNKSKAEMFRKFDTILLKTSCQKQETQSSEIENEQLSFFHENTEADGINNSENAKTAYEFVNDKQLYEDSKGNIYAKENGIMNLVEPVAYSVTNRIDDVLNKIDLLEDSFSGNINDITAHIENEFEQIDKAFGIIDKKIISTDIARKQADTKLRNEFIGSISDITKRLEYYISSLRDYIQNNFVKKDFLAPLDMMKENKTIELTIPEEGLVLQPGVLYIGRTVERTWSDKFIPMINGRSSGGRLGISVHVCAGFGDIGFDGTWTLEITVVEPIRIYANTDIAQVCYFKPCGKVGKLYRGRYYKQEEATASRFYKPKEDI